MVGCVDSFERSFMKFLSSQLFIFSAVIVLGLAGVFALSNSLEKTKPAPREEWVDEDLALQGSKLKGFSFGAEGLLADWYWMKSLQYVGGKLAASKDDVINLNDLRPLNPRLLHPYLDTATDLDPNFMAAYSYGALVLPAIDDNKAIELTEKGIRNNPGEWRLYQYLGYIYWRLKRFDEAADAYERGSRISGSPLFLQMMVGSMKNEGGSRETARAVFRQMYEQANDSETKYYGELRLKYLDSLDEREAMDAALQNFRERTGRCASGWREILPLLAAIKLPNELKFRIDNTNRPVDPSGSAYTFDPATCSVRLDPSSKIPTN